MKIADKIITLRKQSGFSQEELADKINVSRQAVSKWESEQALPDVDKIVLLSEIFGVSTDYLLKDDEVSTTEGKETVRALTESETADFIKIKRKSAFISALGVALCILSPIALIVLAGASSAGLTSEVLASAIGIATIFIFVGSAVALFIYCGYLSSRFSFVETPFTIALSLKTKLKDDKAKFKKTYYLINSISACACVLSPAPIIFSAFSLNSFLVTAMVGVTLLIVALAVFGFVFVGTIMGGYDRLLKEGEYSAEGSKRNALMEKISSIFWLVVVGIFLTWSLIGDAWDKAWIVFPIGGVIFVILSVVSEIVVKKDE